MMSPLSTPLSLPVYIKMTAQVGEKTDILVEIMKRLAATLTDSNDLSLESISSSEKIPNSQDLIYALIITPNSFERDVTASVNILNVIFEKLFDYYPRFTEPM